MKVMHRIMQYVEPRWNNLGKNSMTLRNCMVWPVFKKWHVCWGQRGKSAKRRGWETLTGGACQEKKKKRCPYPLFYAEAKIVSTTSRSLRYWRLRRSIHDLPAFFIALPFSKLITCLIFTDANLSSQNSVQCLDANLAVDLNNYAQFKVSLDIIRDFVVVS